ncbi:MAG: dihydroneopterin aldolase [Candidatus Latescibacteria bacterium]|jgi:dihydroneopterin aldolase|nr:dihydroneopterin aldolase [Candidatus Latescibacterota bacterium]
MDGDWIRIRGIKLYGFHGVYTHEREQGQPFEVDVELQTDLISPGLTDQLARTINYVEIYQLVAKIVAGPSFHLIEALAECIAAKVLSDFPVSSAVIRIRKPEVEMPGPVETVEVEISRP